MNLIRVAITGPESTGKSWLAEKLAGHYQTSWVPEIARDYLNSLGRHYVYEDIAKIAIGQIKLENRLAGDLPGILFCDTDPLVTMIWSQFKYGKCDPAVSELVNNHRYDLYLLCNIDLPWEADPLREHPGEREQLFSIYLEALEGLGANFRVISGIGDFRLQNAISAVNEAFGLTV